MPAQYLDYATPAIAAGASFNGRSWNDGRGRAHHSALNCVAALGLEPLAMDPPPTRSMKAIEREARTLAARQPRSVKAFAEVRAVQYAAAMRGEDYPHSIGVDAYSIRAVRRDTAPDGTSRVRYVGDWEIPHWDFTPTVIDESAPA